MISLDPDIKFPFYMDNTELYIHPSCKNACLQVVQQLMVLSEMKFNPGKNEFIDFGSKVQCQKISSHFTVNIVRSLLHPADIVKNIGVWFDTDISFSDHVQTCIACFLQICDLHRKGQCLTPEVAVLAANALVCSHLDYYNLLFRDLSCFNQYKL